MGIRTKEEVKEELIQFVTFTLENEIYAVDIRNVQEVIERGELTRVPEMPGFIEGFLKLRGNAIPLIDLRKRFNLSSISGTAQKVIVVEVESSLFAVLVDSVSKIIRVEPGEIKPPPEFTSHIGREYLEGIGELGGKFFIVINIQKLFSSDEWISLKK